MTALVDVRDAVKRFGPTVAVDGVSLEVGRGEIVGLLGANGAGKSTAIRMILGLLRPDGGRVELFGVAPSRAARARLGYVPQGLGLYADLTVAENLAFVADAYHAPRPSLDRELARIAHRTIEDVSLGYRRRVAFEAAMSHSPDLLILDEPTSGVGPLGRAELWATIGAAAEAGVGVLVSTHYMEEAEQCDRLVMMAAGRAVAQGTAESIAGSVTTVAVATPDPRAAAAVLEVAGRWAVVDGDGVRVVGAMPDVVGADLRRAGIEAEVTAIPARFDEAFVALSLS